MSSKPGAEVSTSPSSVPYTETPLQGRFVSLELLTRDHIGDLWHTLGFADNDFSIIQWIPMSPVKSAGEFWDTIESFIVDRGFTILAIVGDPSYVNHTTNKNGTADSSKKVALGMIGYFEISTSHRTLETGAVIFSKQLQRSAAATEVHYLQLCNVFEPRGGAPYRRVAWKNNSLNIASHRAAERLGYVYEGTYRNHLIVKGRNRDSDFLSMIEEEWPAAKMALERWLDKTNFDGDGKQLRSLGEIRAECIRQEEEIN